MATPEVQCGEDVRLFQPKQQKKKDMGDDDGDSTRAPIVRGVNVQVYVEPRASSR